ncbi:hypothetical protein [Cupriavidus pauculus]|uniref:hypothetical protein n=1 Tax=Cupriavidus pauculus TaxID=82633 RepID=UPI001FD36A58|nr:hypothetical protein [Cupriavidus pauculus]
MSQRECAGFNWPPLSIPAQEPVSISPEAVSRAGWFKSINATICPIGIPVSCGRGGNTPLLASVAVGVGQPDKHAAAAKSGP